jgi:hypothetical protein
MFWRTTLAWGIDFMKLFLLSLLFVASLAAQTNIVGTWPITINGLTVTVNSTQDAAVAGSNQVFQTAASGTAATTLTVAVTTTGQTTLSLANITGIVLGNGICFSSSATSCAMTLTTNGTTGNLVYSTGEVDRVTSVTPGTGTAGTVTVVRATIGTASTYSNGQAVSIIQYGSYPDLALAYIQAGYSAAIKNCQFLAYSCTQAVSTINTAQTNLSTQSVLPKTN